MRRTLLSVVIFQLITALNAAPSIEPCPSDSVKIEDTCKCDHQRCSKPPCLSTLVIKRDRSDTPGDCCPIYSCEDCDDSDKIDGKCPCAPGATIDEFGKCSCHDPQKTLIDNECICNPDQCPLPILCDSRSISVIESNGCCNITKCITCPDDSFVPTLKNDSIIEPKCVCYPCADKQCGPNEIVDVKQKGRDFPGNCCDIYECKPISCTVDNKIYNNGEKWVIADTTRCECHNGITFCDEPENERFKPCHTEGNIYWHNETWMVDNCTQCTCIDGEKNCIAHMCDTVEERVKPHCQPLKCSKSCPGGYKVNKRGCQICKCDTKIDDLLQRFNITKNQLEIILEEHFSKDESDIEKTTSIETTTSSSTTTTSSSTSTTTTSTTTSTSTICTTIPTVPENFNVSETPKTLLPVSGLSSDTVTVVFIVVPIVFVLAIIAGLLFCKYRGQFRSYNTSQKSTFKRYKKKGDDFINNCCSTNSNECEENMLKH